MGTITTTTFGKPFDISHQSQERLLQYYLNSNGLNKNITVLNLEKVNWTILDLKAIIRTFPFLENLTVENSNISDVIPPETNNIIKVNDYNYF